jgi:hypothetical protein
MGGLIGKINHTIRPSLGNIMPFTDRLFKNSGEFNVSQPHVESPCLQYVNWKIDPLFSLIVRIAKHIMIS